MLRRSSVPHVAVLLTGLGLLVAVLSLGVPAGTRGEAPHGPALVAAALTAPLRGLVDAAPLAVFLLVLGGAFRVIETTHVLDAAFVGMVRQVDRAKPLVVPLAMAIFAAGGALGGLGEEKILPFVFLFLALSRILGYHPVVGVAVPLVGAHLGYAVHLTGMPPLADVQGLAGLPLGSGWPLRAALGLAAAAAGIAFVTVQARRWDFDQETLDPDFALAPLHMTGLSWPQRGTLLLVAAGGVAFVWGAVWGGWSVLEIGALLAAAGLAAGLTARLSIQHIVTAFFAGARDLTAAVVVLGIARGVFVLAAETGLLDAALNGAAAAVASLPGLAALGLMLFVQSAAGVVLPGSLEQAAHTLPLFLPAAEAAGLTPQITVLAFQLGDGFSKLILPTSAVLLGALGAGKVPWEQWFGFVWRLQAGLFLFALAALAVAFATGYGA